MNPKLMMALRDFLGARPMPRAGTEAQDYYRRAADRRAGQDRRGQFWEDHSARTPTRDEQRAQYFTRLLFWALGLAYFNLGGATHTSEWLSLGLVNTVLFLYGAQIVFFMWHALRRLHAPWRWRLTMWLDLFAASMAILADPAVISPGFLAYLMVILGNGMRYGLRLFAEAVIGSFLCALFVIGLRYLDYLGAFSISAIFFLLFFTIIVLYSYSLTANIEKGKRKLETERNNDHLTGLLNRRALHEQVEGLFKELGQRRETIVVLFADLDRFKAINDTQGHHVGDRVLAEVGRMIVAKARASDLVARYGGDEFILILRETDLAGGALVAQRLQRLLASWSRSNNIDTSFSIGLGQYPDHGDNLAAVIERVDHAMYRSKQAHGRGGILQVGQTMMAQL